MRPLVLLGRFAIFIAIFTTANPGRAADPPHLFLGRSVPEWSRDLNDRSPDVRRSAAFALGKLGGEAVPAVTELLRLLRDERSPAVRDMAAAALGDIVAAFGAGSAGLWREAGAPLLEMVQRDPDANARRSAAYAIGNFGPAASEAREALVTALNDTNAAVRQNAAWALGKLGQESSKQAVAALCDRLKDGEPLVRRDAALALAAIGPPLARSAVRPLLELVKQTKDDVVLNAALEPLTALATAEERDAAPVLLALLKRDDADTRRLAAFALARMGGPGTEAALGVLRPLLREADPRVQEVTAAALASLGPAAAPAVPDLARLLQESADPVVTRNVVLALGAIGKEAAPAVPQLIRAIGPSQPREVRLYAAEALKRVESPGLDAAVPALLTVIRTDDDATIRQRCIFAVWQVDDLRKVKAVDTLTACLHEKKPNAAVVRYAAAIALAFHLRDETPELAADVLCVMLKDRTLITRSYADVAVGAATSEGRTGRSEVQESNRGDARWLAAEAIGAMGRAANRPEVLDALRGAASDDNTKLGDAAKKALERIRRAAN